MHIVRWTKFREVEPILFHISLDIAYIIFTDFLVVVVWLTDTRRASVRKGLEYTAFVAHRSRTTQRIECLVVGCELENIINNTIIEI